MPPTGCVHEWKQGGPMEQGSARVVVGGCRWEWHGEFPEDLNALAMDEMTRRELAQLMRRAAEGTIRSDEWEYPLRSGGNLIGELRMDIEELKYRLYYNEPDRDMELLYAVVMGCKVHDDDGEWYETQQAHIEQAKLRLFTDGWY